MIGCHECEDHSEEKRQLLHRLKAQEGAGAPPHTTKPN